LVDYLAARPSDFRGAIARMNAELSSLYLGAYQSHLWNRFLSEWLIRRVPPSQRVSVRLKLDDVAMPRGVTLNEQSEMAALALPLPAARLRYDDAIPNAPADWPVVLHDVLAGEGIDLAQLKLKGLRRPYFSRGERPIFYMPKDLGSEAGPDDRHSGRFKLILN